MFETNDWLKGYIPEAEYEQVKEMPSALLTNLYSEFYALGKDYDFIEKVGDYLHEEFSAATNQSVYEKQRPFYDDFVEEIDKAPQEWLDFYTSALKQSSQKRRGRLHYEGEAPMPDERKFATDARIIKFLRYTMKVANSPKGVHLSSVSEAGGGFVDGQAIVYGIFWALVGEGILDPDSKAEQLRPSWEAKVLAIAERRMK